MSAEKKTDVVEVADNSATSTTETIPASDAHEFDHPDGSKIKVSAREYADLKAQGFIAPDDKKE